MKIHIESNFVSTRLGHAMRQKRGLDNSLQDIAKELGTSASTLSRIERGAGLPHPALFVRIMTWLGINKNQYTNYVDHNTY